MDGLKFRYRFIPLRFSPRYDKFVGLVIGVENNSDSKKLVSVDVNIKTNSMLGLDPAAVHKKGIKKIGEINPGERKEVMVRIYGAPNLKAGDYEIEIVLNEHYLDFDKILERKRKTALLRVEN